ncbi:MAG: FliG C-terminal domain-containing protein [Pseudomonadota bacterium]
MTELKFDGAFDAAAPAVTGPAGLTRGQKAAVIVRLMLAHDIPAPLDRLAARQQERLAHLMTSIDQLDRSALASVVDEFVDALDGVALSFPRGLPDALDLLEPYLSANTREELASEANKRRGEAWERLAALDIEELSHLISEESAEVCAILLSKLPAEKAAGMLMEMEPDTAEEISQAVGITGTVSPHTVARIGKALVAKLDAKPAPAFRVAAADRLGLILNAAKSALREDLLDRLQAKDADFAEEVRRTIFTFDHIPARLAGSDVPALVRSVEGEVLTIALASALERMPLAADFLLDNMSKRMAETLREEAMSLGGVSEEEGEDAMTKIITALRGLEESGEIKLIVQEAAE